MLFSASAEAIENILEHARSVEMKDVYDAWSRSKVWPFPGYNCSVAWLHSYQCSMPLTG